MANYGILNPTTWGLDVFSTLAPPHVAALYAATSINPQGLAFGFTAADLMAVDGVPDIVIVQSLIPGMANSAPQYLYIDPNDHKTLYNSASLIAAAVSAYGSAKWFNWARASSVIVLVQQDSPQLVALAVSSYPAGALPSFGASSVSYLSMSDPNPVVQGIVAQLGSGGANGYGEIAGAGFYRQALPPLVLADANGRILYGSMTGAVSALRSTCAAWQQSMGMPVNIVQVAVPVTPVTTNTDPGAQALFDQILIRGFSAAQAEAFVDAYYPTTQAK